MFMIFNIVWLVWFIEFIVSYIISIFSVSLRFFNSFVTCQIEYMYVYNCLVCFGLLRIHLHVNLVTD